MMPTYQLPMVKGNDNNGKVYFKHDFGNLHPYVQVPAFYAAPVGVQQPPIAGDNAGHRFYGVPYSPPPVRLNTQTVYGTPQQHENQLNQQQYQFNNNQNYGAPLTSYNTNNQQQNLQFTAPTGPSAQAATQQQPAITTYRPNTQTIDNSAITFTTGRPQQQHNRPLRFTQSAAFVTNPEYIPPPNILPLEGENSALVPVPIPNLSATPIPPLYDAQPFGGDPFKSQTTGFIKLIPLNPSAQLSTSIAVDAPSSNVEKLPRFESPNVQVVNSNLVAEFTLPTTSNGRVSLPPPTPSLHNSNIDDNYQLSVDFANSIDIRPNHHDSAAAGSELNFHENVHQDIVDDGHHHRGDEQQLIDNLIGTVPTTTRAPKTTTTTTTASSKIESDHYVVKFEPSQQTAADLVAKKVVKEETKSTSTASPSSSSTTTTTTSRRPTMKPAKLTTTTVKPPSKSRGDRLTPLELLDSPIFHLTSSPSKSKVTQPVTEPVPVFRPMNDFTKKLATLWTTTPPPGELLETTTITSTSEATATTTTPFTPTSTRATTLDILSKLAGGAFAGITPPKESQTLAKASSQATKKPKQVQIVIPYTSFHKPAPFKAKEPTEQMIFKPIKGHYVTRNTTPKNEIEIEPLGGHGFHNDQEYHDHAQESKIVESKISYGATTPSTKYITKILANNIRELLLKERTPKPFKVDLIKLQKNIDGWTEQSYSSGKSSTIALMAHTKAIPDSFFLPTTVTMRSLPTTTLSPKTTFDPDLMEETRRQYDNILFKNLARNKGDELYVKRHDRFLDRDNELVLINNNLTFNAIHDNDIKVRTQKPTLTLDELWRQLHVTISPLTNEKVYVVTPQALAQQQQPVTQPSTTTVKARFAVRPTIGELFFFFSESFIGEEVEIKIFFSHTN